MSVSPDKDSRPVRQEEDRLPAEDAGHESEPDLDLNIGKAESADSEDLDMLTPAEYTQMFSLLSSAELEQSTLLFEYVTPSRAHAILCCQNLLQDELLFLHAHGTDRPTKIVLPSDYKRISGQAKRILKLLPPELKEQLKEYYAYLRTTMHRGESYRSESTGGKSKKAEDRSREGMHQRRNKKPLN